MEFVLPEYQLEAFNCPWCNAYSHMNWSQLMGRGYPTDFYICDCSYCKNSSVWHVTKHDSISPLKGKTESGVMIFPDSGSAKHAELDMPEDVKIDYQEAASIFHKSPRGAAALLRLGLQKLCKHLGEKGENINDDIRALASKNVLPPMVIKVADTVRITGNNAVHPGEMSDEDFDYVASKMFDLLNFIVKKGITEPKELEALYQMTPSGPRESAEKRDKKSKGESA